MSLKTEINAAIVSHSVWKTRLHKAVESGVLDSPVEVIKLEDQCAFGKWLLGPTITPAVRQSAEYTRVRALHADFHRVAAKVATLVVQGNKREAEKLMALHGEYTEATTALVLELRAWAKRLE